jgi:hypothetical protein
MIHTSTVAAPYRADLDLPKYLRLGPHSFALLGSLSLSLSLGISFQKLLYRYNIATNYHSP